MKHTSINFKQWTTVTMYIGRKFKQDKKLKLNMKHTSINFKQWTTVT